MISPEIGGRFKSTKGFLLLVTIVHETDLGVDVARQISGRMSSSAAEPRPSPLLANDGRRNSRGIVDCNQ